jgi:hypothetical protein
MILKKIMHQFCKGEESQTHVKRLWKILGRFCYGWCYFAKQCDDFVMARWC